MLIISHRGNLNGVIPALENKPDYINEALQKGFNVEIDVWYNKKVDHLSLGHDRPQYGISKDFLEMQNGLWCHAKNLDALEYLNKMHIKNYFFHERDSYTLTSRKYIWAFTGEKINKNCIVMFPEKLKPELYKNCYGVCTDYAERY